MPSDRKTRAVPARNNRCDYRRTTLATAPLNAQGVLGAGMRARERPEAQDINYVTRVKIPTLMLNGRYDIAFPYEASVKPMFDLLGTPAAHKRGPAHACLGCKRPVNPSGQ